MILGAITGVPTPACLSTTSNPVEAVTPPLWVGPLRCCPCEQLCEAASQMHNGTAKNFPKYTSGPMHPDNGVWAFLMAAQDSSVCVYFDSPRSVAQGLLK